MGFSDLVEGDKNLVGESNNWGIFLGGREENEQIFCGLFPITYPIRKNPPMFFQFGPKLENLMMILGKAFFHLSILISWGAMLWQK